MMFPVNGMVFPIDIAKRIFGRDTKVSESVCDDDNKVKFYNIDLMRQICAYGSVRLI